MTDWAAHEGRCLIHLLPDVITLFHEYVQRNPSDPESGGILLGTVHGPHNQVVHATPPFPTDRRTRCSFDRGSEGHTEVADQFWRESSGIIRYIGEWHTHPEDYPSPSGIDLREWKISAAKRTDGRPVIGLIVGRKAIYIQSTSATGKALVYQALLGNCPALGH
ncbi:Mov34/MPN/PAD-1 family protein [Pseudomonas sp. Irchel 3F3]|uniref:Mov34/MPN/PAD-1 family protein n=1 Tax=Pseudomonas sp. Irchel 3F3 TaxID=2009000 RepID=UPI000BA375FB|nr:Mov34/MPN/PAD-1 family protein [Pseudomonas sp. Irchel 3F3]